MIKYLSPSSLALFEKQPEEFYYRNLSKVRAPRQPQTQAAAAGAAFDAYVKSAIGGFDFKELFEKQVEEHNREWAHAVGAHLFDCYERSDALNELGDLIGDNKARFEFSIEGTVGGVPLLGKPDCEFTRGEASVVLDWKVNGAASKSAVSPYKNYLQCDGKRHKGCDAIDYKGVTIHSGCLSEASSDWADQLSIYAWLLGHDVGEDFIAAVDQLVCKPTDTFPVVRVAQHRTRISGDYQRKVLTRLQTAWEAISTGHVFMDLSREESDLKCEQLEREAAAMTVGDDPWDDFFSRSTRVGYRG